MSNEANMHGHAEVITHHEVHHDEHHVHHHKETFITKYIFSQDHKTIGKQFLITGIVWAIIGGLFSVLFRLQLGFPEQTFPILETFFGKWAAGGVIQPEFYYALVTIHGTVLVFFVLTAGLSGTFANLLIPLQIGARDMASPFLNMLSYWFFFICSYRPGLRRVDSISATQCITPGIKRIADRNGSMARQHGDVHCFVIAWRFKLYRNYFKYAHKRNEHDKDATHNVGYSFHRDPWCTFIPCPSFRCHPFVI